MEQVVQTLDVVCVVLPGCFAELLLKPLQVLYCLGCTSCHRTCCDLAGQQRLGHEQIADVFSAQRSYHETAAGLQDHESLTPQGQKSLAHGRCTYAEFFSDLILPDMAPGEELTADDQLADVISSLVTELAAVVAVVGCAAEGG